jgi:hypothetical protein
LGIASRNRPPSADAQQRAEAAQKLAEREEQERRTGKKMRGRKPELADPEQAKPADATRRRGHCGQVFVRGVERNFVDPESRIMPDGVRAKLELLYPVKLCAESPLQPAWQRECPPRVEAGVRCQQPAEALPVWMGHANGIKRRAKQASSTKTER